MDNPLYIVLLFALGVVAGFQNVMAGGGSLLTLPMMIFMLETDPSYAAQAGVLANATNRVAILIQNISAVLGFRRKGVADFKTSLKLAAFTLPGAVLGALFAGGITSASFKRILGFVVIGVVVLMLQKKKLTQATTTNSSAFIISIESVKNSFH